MDWEFVLVTRASARHAPQDGGLVLIVWPALEQGHLQVRIAASLPMMPDQHFQTAVYTKEYNGLMEHLIDGQSRI